MTGLLLVAKPSGPTSYDLIRWAKHAAPGVKIGHCGTLDPMATGLMILLFGRATKSQDNLMHQPKTYRGTLRLGIQTDSGDITGAVIAEAAVPVVTAALLDVVARDMVRDHEQTPPMYSAVKVNGTPLYKLARKGETVERKSRTITIFSFEFLNTPSFPKVPVGNHPLIEKGGFPIENFGNDGICEISFRVRCSSGTYVRTLAEDIGRRLGSMATLSALEREEVGAYHVNAAIPGDSLRHLTTAGLEQKLLPVPA
jgi:tRNA pseudouridine55 synthase